MDMSGVMLKMAMMMVLIAIGYFCGKIKVAGPEFTRSASWIVVNIFTCAMIISSAANSHASVTGETMVTVTLWMSVFFIINALIGWLTPKIFRVKSGADGVMIFMIGVMNTVFIGYPVLQIVYGDMGIFYASLSNIPSNILIYSWGVNQLSKGTPGYDGRIQWRKMLSAPMVSTLIAVIIFATKLQLPQIVTDTLDTLSGATIPLSMIVVGATLSRVPLGETFKDKNTYIMSFVRLIVCPVATFFALKWFIKDPVILGTIVILASTPAAVLAATLGIECGRDGVAASRGIFVSTVLSVFTIPLIIWLLL